MSDLAELLPHAVEPGSGHHTRLSERIDARLASIVATPSGSAGWERSRARRAEADRLAEEVVGLLVTRLLRTQIVGAGVFDGAHALLASLARRARVPEVALVHTQGSETTDPGRGSVAVRFPGAGVWDLPFLAHEFGHHAVAHLEDERRPVLGAVVDVVADVSSGRGSSPDVDRAHAEELVADAVATVCLGSVYPLACLCLRAPRDGEAATSNATHPSWRHRVSTMRATLDALTSRTGRGRYRRDRHALVDPVALDVLGVLPSGYPPAVEAAEGVVEVAWRHRRSLIYDDGDAAIGVAAALARGDRAVPPGVAAPAVVDGAWRWRLDGHGTPTPRLVAAAESSVIDYLLGAAEVP